MASPIIFNLQAPRPPSSQETNEDPTRTLLWIQDRITEIYTTKRPDQQQDDTTTSTPPKTEQAAYLDIYNAVNNYINATKAARSVRDSHVQATLDEEEIYHGLERGIRAYCQETLGQIIASPWILTTYVEHWTVFLGITRRGTRLFQFLERHWIRRVVDEKRRKGIVLLHELHMRSWREEVLGVASKKIVDAMTRIEHEGGSQAGEDESKLRDDCIASLREAGLEVLDGSLVALKS